MNNLEIITLSKPRISDFAAERNGLLKKAKSKWVLFLDSDEKLTPELEKEIPEAISKARGEGGFYIKRKIYFLGNYAGTDKVLRLATKGAGKWSRAVHETWDVKTRFGTLSGYIIHNTGDNLRDYIDKINKYSDIHALENKKEGKKPTVFKIIFYPMAKFLQNIYMGRGFVFSMLQSFHSFLSWTKQRELEKK